MASDPFSELRDHLHAAVNDAVANLDYSHSQLLGQQVSALSHDDDALLPALLCAFIAETLGAAREPALVAGAAFALLEASAYVVDDLVGAGAAGPARGLMTAWGATRTLNASDGFFALAHESLLSLQDHGLEAAGVLSIGAEFDDVVRAWSADATDRYRSGEVSTAHPHPAVLAGACSIGARVAGAEPALAAAIAEALTSGSPAEVAALGLSATETTTLSAAATYLAGVARQ